MKREKIVTVIIGSLHCFEILLVVELEDACEVVSFPHAVPVNLRSACLTSVTNFIFIEMIFFSICSGQTTELWVLPQQEIRYFQS